MAEESIQFLKGVGPGRAEIFARVGVRTLDDLLGYYPRDWQDRRPTADLSLPTATGLVVVRGKVVKSGAFPAGASLSLFRAQIATGTETLTALWFKHRSRRFDVFAQLKRDVSPGADLWLVGRGEAGISGISELHVDEYYRLDDPRAPLHVDRLVPIYPLTEGLSQRFVRELVHQALLKAAAGAAEILPRALRDKRQLLSAGQALKGIHFPGSQAELSEARNRLAYEELLLLELAWILKRRQTRSVSKGHRYEIKRTLLSPFRENLGFELTGAQKRVINEVFSDLQKPYPMTRLLQGDVGSGKTVVALAALLLAVENGGQGVLMAPTEILAEQHFQTLSRALKGLPVRAAVLTSRVPARERKSLVAAAAAGELDVVVGTHALLEGDVTFPRLRLAVIDEQHRFGVRQRATLRQKSELLDLLIMTATPIPRTLALALYGELDTSTIDEMPPGKARARTLQAAEAQALDAVRRAAGLGRQAFIVYPVIEEGGPADLQSAKVEHARLSETELRGLRVGLIHGALPGRQKAAVMSQFAQGRLDVLVATQVIEVGIDVPNATVMVIQNADRFGLASLHQLRGRIGRGSAEAECYLVGEARSPQARQRLDIMTATHDGFRIGEEDLKLRGPGEFVGTAQHGELSLRVADLARDAALLAQARQDAEELLAGDARLQAPELRALRGRLVSLYQRQWNWIDLA